MNDDPPPWLPGLLLLSDCKGIWGDWLDALYGSFQTDFVHTQINFRGKPVQVGNQLIDGKERTFWHMIQEGKVEQSRTPDSRRCERIKWAKAIIEHDGDPQVLSWPNKRKRQERFVLWVPSVDFAVILEDRRSHWMLWTTYVTDRRHTQRVFQEEYEQYKSTCPK